MYTWLPGGPLPEISAWLGHAMHLCFFTVAGPTGFRKAGNSSTSETISCCMQPACGLLMVSGHHIHA